MRIYSPIESAVHDPDEKKIPVIEFAEQEPLLGPQATMLVAERSFGSVGNLRTSIQTISGNRIDAARVDEIIVDVPSPDGSGRRQARIDGDDWRALKASSSAMDLGPQNANNRLYRKRRPVRYGEDGGGTGRLLIGRDANGNVRVQNDVNDLYASTATPFNVRIYTVGHGGGLLERRLDALRETFPQQVVLHRRGVDTTTVPDAPLRPTTYQPFSYSGGLQLTEADMNGWCPIGMPLPSGSTPVYIARNTFTYNENTGLWGDAGWTVANANVDVSAIQFANYRSGPWSSSDGGWPEAWMRFRKADGTWQVAQLRVNPTRMPSLVFDETIAPGTATVFKDFDPEFNWKRREWMWWQYRTTNTAASIGSDWSYHWITTQPIAAKHVFPIGRLNTEGTVDGLHEVPDRPDGASVNLRFGGYQLHTGTYTYTYNEHYGGMAILGPLGDSDAEVEGAGPREQRIRLNFGTRVGLSATHYHYTKTHCARLLVRLGYTARYSRLRMWVA